MTKTITLAVTAAVAALSYSLVDSPTVSAQYATIVEVTTPERPIPPPVEVRGHEHQASNPYFGLRSSYLNVRRYYSNPVKTIPQQTTRTIIVPYRGRYPYYRGYPAYPYGYGYGYGYPWGFRP